MRIVRIACIACIASLGGLPAAAAAATAAISLHECRLQHPLEIASAAARCAMLKVAENPLQPAGRAIELRVAVVPALNRRAHAAPLFLLAGGPGQAATDLYVSYAGAFARINRNHDIVLVDQRGTGGSAPLFCSYPEDWLDADQALPALRQATRDCLSRFGESVRYFTSSLAVRDLEEVRGALRYGQIDLYGASYGTRVAELYMRRYPANVRAVILDGVTHPEQAIGPDTPFDGERALGLIVTRCLAAPDCAAAYPDLKRNLDELRRRFGPEKVALTLSDPSTGRPLQIEFGHAVFSASLRFLSYSSTEAALLPDLIHRAAGGELEPLAAQALMASRLIRGQLASGMQNSVICSEDLPFYSTGDIDQGRLAQTYQGTDQLQAFAEVCKLWPRGPVDPDLHAALRSDVPTLLLSGEADPVTPPADAERLARGLGRHRHLLLPGEGHGQLATGCMPKLMAEFLDNPDPQALDAACLERHLPAPFFVSPTGAAP